MPAWTVKKALMLALAASASPAALLLRGETNGIAASFRTKRGNICIRDTTTPANNYDGPADVFQGVGASNKSITPVMLADGTYDWSPHNQLNTDFSAGWTYTAAAVTLNNTTDPDGGSTGVRVAGNSTGTGTVAFQMGSFVGRTWYTLAIYLKAGSRSWVKVFMTSDVDVNFDIGAGVMGTQTLGTGTITDVGGGWYLCTATWFENGTGSFNSGLDLRLGDSDADFSVDRTNASYIYAWRPRLNRGKTIQPMFLNTTSGALLGPVIGYIPAIGSYAYIHECTQTTRLQYSRSLDTSPWTASNMTVALDQDGIVGGGTADCCSLLATAANATLTQAVVSTSVLRRFSWFAKRLVGTGTIEVSLDNGATWTQFTLTGSWQRFTFTQTLADPTVIIRIVTSGDKIAVDFVNLVDETSATGSALTSPILAFNAATSRQDSWRLQGAVTLSASEATLYARMAKRDVTTSINWGFVANANSGSNGVGLNVEADADIRGAATSAGSVIAGTTPKAVNDVVYQHTLAAKVNDYAQSVDGGAVLKDTSQAFPSSAPTRIQFGDAATSGAGGSAHYCTDFAIVPRRVLDADLPTWRYVA